MHQIGSGYPHPVTETTPRNQPQYQVRFEWGIEGAQAITPDAHVLVWVDALSTPSAVDPAALPFDGAVLLGTVGNRDAIAQWILDLQVVLGDRATVAVVAAGEDGRFAVEDLLAAGAIVDALADVGIDYISPEAAAAVGAFVGLRNATSHVLSASVTGQELIKIHGKSVIEAARVTNSEPTATVVREFTHPQVS